MSKLRDVLRRFWYGHVQYTLGVLMAAAGLLEYVDANTINLIGGFFGQKYGPMVSKILQCGAGLLIAIRARQASKPQLDIPPYRAP